jgi:hypothetical protein
LALRSRPEEAVGALQQAQGLDLIDAQTQVEEMTRLSMKSIEEIENPDGTIKEEGPTDKIAEIFGSKYNRYFILRLLCCVRIGSSLLCIRLG